MRDSLNLQADRIEHVLHSHRIPATVIGGVVTARIVEFRLAIPESARIGQVSRLCEELALALGAPACRVARREGSVVVEVPRAEPQMVDLMRLCRSLADVPPCTAVLGVSQEGRPLLLRLSSPDVAHVLVAGTTGSGKTELARSMIASLAAFHRRSELLLALMDPKSRGFAAFADLPHLERPIVADIEAARALFAHLVREMESRDRERRSEPRIVTVIDELADLLMEGGKEVEAALTRLTQRGRGAGIHVVACTQKPTAAVIGSLIKSNFPIRLVGSVASPEDAKVASGVAGCGAEKLLGRGDFMLIGRGRAVRFQAARVSDEDIAALALPRSARAPASRIAPAPRQAAAG